MTTVVIGDDSGTDYAGTIDGQVKQAAATTNYGSTSDMETTDWAVGDVAVTFLKFSGLSNISGPVTVNSASIVLSLKTAVGLNGTYAVEAYRLLRDIVESEMTWNQASSGVSWTTGGAFDTTNDVSSTKSAEVTNISTTTGTDWTWTAAQLAADFEDFINGDLSNYGHKFQTPDPLNTTGYHNDSRKWHSSEASDGSRPYLSLDYTAGGASVTLTGLSSTGSVGSLSIAGGASVSLSGLSSTGGIGTMGSTGGAVVNVSGLSASGFAGDLSITGGAVVNIGGLSVTGSAGSLSITGGAAVSLAGLSATGGIGAFSVVGGAAVNLTGLQAVGSIGSLTISLIGGVNVALTGLSASGQIGDLGITGGAAVNLSGLSATGDIGLLSAASHVSITLTGLQATAQQGVFTVAGGSAIVLTGLSATGQIGTIVADVGGGFSVETPIYRIYTITRDNRTYLIVEDKRINPVGDDDRTYPIH